MSPDTDRPAGIPGLWGLDHVGLTVPDLKEAVDFFVTVIGCEHVYDGEPAGGDGDFMRERLNVHPEASCRYCFLRCRSGLNLELFEYSAPDRRTEPPRNSDVGGHHIAFYVEDMDAAVGHLRAHGVRILGEPMLIAEGPSAGATWVYFLAPWGLQLELCCAPGGKAYEGTARRLLWHPKFPGRDPVLP